MRRPVSQSSKTGAAIDMILNQKHWNEGKDEEKIFYSQLLALLHHVATTCTLDVGVTSPHRERPRCP